LEGKEFSSKPRAKTRGEIADLYSAVIASAAKQSTLSCRRMDCFASLAMTFLGSLKIESVAHLPAVIIRESG